MGKLLFVCLFLFVCGCASTSAQLQLTGRSYNGDVSPEVQERAAGGVVQRLLGPDAALHFTVEVVPGEETDYFEVVPVNGGITLRGSSGVAACRGLKWYLNTLCHCSVSWRGDNLALPDELPMDFVPHREETTLEYRYIFNNCIYGYSMPWWQWEDWQRMLDVLAFNGINTPAMLLGQEKVWQETYKEFGLNNEDLETFFAGPAWYPWQWMGNLDGWGGPTPQSVIDGQAELQKQIVSRARSLGMRTVLPGFSGHVPAALVKVRPGITVHKLYWWGFGPTYMLDWQDPMFVEIGKTFLEKQRELYGTDHLYNIDPFNEMTPPSSDKTYLTKMAQTIFASIQSADPQGIWVLMTWFAKQPATDMFWTPERTSWFFDAVPDDRVLALELYGEKWSMTGWHLQSGWYGKPWVWCILQNFGNRVDLYGGLDQIVANYRKVLDSPDRGRISGMGIMTEGLGYNPVVYELVLDMMWGDGVQDLDAWKQAYLRKRYGAAPPSIQAAWDALYRTRYNKVDLISISPLCMKPRLVSAFEMDAPMVEAWGNLIHASDEVAHTPAFSYDLVNVGREAMGTFAPYYTIAIRDAFEAKDLPRLRKANADMLQYIRDFDRLMGTDQAFLLGRWINGARSWGSNDADRALLEWGAKRQITDWGGEIGSYAIKEWSGYMIDRMYPAWEYYLRRMEESVAAGAGFDEAACFDEIDAQLARWPSVHSDLPAHPVGDPVAVSLEMWNKYHEAMEQYSRASGSVSLTRAEAVKGLAYKRPVTATGQEKGAEPAFAVDGSLSGKYWAALAPASLTVDLGEPVKAAAFQVYPYRGDNRYYHYTIEISSDGANWMPVVDMSENKEIATVEGHLHLFHFGYTFRYARLTMLHNSVNPSVHVYEFKVLSEEDLERLRAGEQ